MYKKILIATDGSELADGAVDHGLRLAEALQASVVILTVTELWSTLQMSEDVQPGKLAATEAGQDTEASAAAVILERAAAMAAAIGVASETRHVRDRDPAEGILDTAELEECDLIVMASHGRKGLGRILLGSQTAEVLAKSKRPVLVLR